MRQLSFEITVPGQMTGPAELNTFILDSVSVAPERKRPVIMICPGGGYRVRSDREREPIVTQFLAMGYHVGVLEYSVCTNRFPVAVMELAKAIALVRQNCDDWLGDRNRILVCGFSAGGHLACSAGAFWNREFVYGPISCSPEEIRPDGMILAYPVITSGEFGHRGSFDHLVGESASEEELFQVSLEKQVTADMPPAFIWHTYTDPAVPAENSLLLAAAMKRQGVNFELHIYPVGGHGLALANKETGGSEPRRIVEQCQSWIPLVKTWMENQFG